MNNNFVKQYEIDNFPMLSSKPDTFLIIYFAAPWCQPCLSMKPVFTRLAEQLSTDKLIFGEVNIAASPTIAQKYGIRSVPTIAIFNQDKIIKTISGELSFNDAKDRLIKQLYSQQIQH